MNQVLEEKEDILSVSFAQAVCQYIVWNEHKERGQVMSLIKLAAHFGCASGNYLAPTIQTMLVLGEQEFIVRHQISSRVLNGFICWLVEKKGLQIETLKQHGFSYSG